MRPCARLRLAALALAAVLALPVALTAAPAQAKPQVRERYHDTYSDTFDCDGLVTLHVEGEVSGLFMLKQGRRGDPTPYWFDNFAFREVYTAVPDTGRWITIEGNLIYKDLRIVQTEGTVHTFEAIQVGQLVVRDADGNVVFRDRGRLLFRFVVDTLGDNDPDNDIPIDGTFEVLAENGPHPWWDETDKCQWAADYLLG
jgi:hypothetical protein